MPLYYSSYNIYPNLCFYYQILSIYVEIKVYFHFFLRVEVFTLPGIRI
jgi:hypothetical protein